MVMKALQQLLFEVKWDKLDYLVIDMPPGTGDTQLTISQQVKVDGAVIVSTPQDIALINAVKGITMFNKVNIPVSLHFASLQSLSLTNFYKIIGLVQNMSYFLCPNCNHESHVFGTDGALKEAKKQNLRLLGSIPLNEEICLQSDKGKPVVVSHVDKDPLTKPYFDIAHEVVKFVDQD